MEAFSAYSLARVNQEIDAHNLESQRAGDSSLRQMLVQCRQFILGRFGRDCNLRRWGQSLMSRGGKNAKKRTVIAVARKLAVLLHALLVSDKPYDPFYKQSAIAA